MAKDTRKYIPESHDLSTIAPRFRERVDSVVHNMTKKGHDPFVFETIRVEKRQWWIFGCGRDEQACISSGVPKEYAWATGDQATNAASYLKSVHGHGLAVDVISKSKMWSAPKKFWDDLGIEVLRHDLTWGGSWKSPHDLPHFQWKLTRSGVVYAGPSSLDIKRTLDEGVESTWHYYKAA